MSLKGKVAFHGVACFVLFSLHFVLPSFKMGKDFTPFAFTPSGHLFDEAHFYAPGAHRYSRFGILSHDTDVFERRNDPGVYAQGPSFLIGGLSKLIGNFELTWILLHGLLPALLWLLCFILTKNVWASWAVTAIGFGPRLGLLLGKEAFLEPPDITRLPNPGLSSVYLVFAVFVLSRARRSPHWMKALGAGLIAGLLFEMYTFYGIAWLIAVGGLFLVSFLQKKKTDWQFFLLVIAGSCLSAFPSLWKIVQYQSHLEASTWLRQGMLSREISWPGLLVMLVGFIGTYHAWKKNALGRALLFAFLFAGGVGSNLQVLSGTDIHYWLHYRMRLIQPVAVLLLALAVPRRLTPLLTTLVLCLLLYRQYSVGSNLLKVQKSRVETTRMLHWVQENFQNESVFSTTHMELIAILPAITGHWSYVPSSYRTQSPDEEILKRYTLASRYEGKTLEETLNALKAPALDPNSPWTLPVYLLLRRPSVTEGMELLVREYWFNAGEEALAEERKLDFLIVKSSVPLSDYTPVFENSEWRILSVNTERVIARK